MKIILTSLVEGINSPSSQRNPADIRRIDLLASNLSKHGYECHIRANSAVLEQECDVVITQSRDYRFWLKNKKTIRANVKKFIFTCSDAMGSTHSLVHNNSSRLKKILDRFVNMKNKPEFDFLEGICDLIIVGSNAQKEIIENIGVSTPIIVIEDFIDKETYQYFPVLLPKQAINIFWEGYIDNVPYLESCAEALKNLSKQYDLRIYLLTSKQRRRPYLGSRDNEASIATLFGEVATFIEWTDENVQKYMAQCHIGIAPLFQTDAFAMAKPANKLIIYNYMGLYAVASATPAYKSYIEKGGIGVIVSDWEIALEDAFKNAIKDDIRAKAHAHANKYFGDEVLIKKYIEYCDLGHLKNEISEEHHV